MFRVFGSAIYTILDSFISIDHLSLLKDKLSKHDNRYEKTKFNGFNGMEIPEILMNIVSFHGFAKYQQYKVILSCRSALVSYSISKLFVIVEK